MYVDFCALELFQSWLLYGYSAFGYVCMTVILIIDETEENDCIKVIDRLYWID